MIAMVARIGLTRGVPLGLLAKAVRTVACLDRLLATGDLAHAEIGEIASLCRASYAPML